MGKSNEAGEARLIEEVKAGDKLVIDGYEFPLAEVTLSPASVAVRHAGSSMRSSYPRGTTVRTVRAQPQGPSAPVRPASSGSFDQATDAVRAKARELAGGLAEAVAKDEQDIRNETADCGFDLSAGLMGVHVSTWLTGVARELVDAQAQRPTVDAAAAGHHPARERG